MKKLFEKIKLMIAWVTGVLYGKKLAEAEFQERANRAKAQNQARMVERGKVIKGKWDGLRNASGVATASPGDGGGMRGKDDQS